MRKILSILGIITLIGTSTTSLVACNKKDNNGKKRLNYNPKKAHAHPKQPQKNEDKSNWKLDNNPNFINYNVDNKWYVAIFKNYTKNWYIVNFLNSSENDKILGTFSFDGSRKNIYLSNIRKFFKLGNVKIVYRWDGNNKPETPKIDKDNGKIIDWK